MIVLMNKDANELVSWGFHFPMYFETIEDVYSFLNENARGIKDNEKFCIIDWETNESVVIQVNAEVKIKIITF